MFWCYYLPDILYQTHRHRQTLWSQEWTADPDIMSNKRQIYPYICLFELIVFLLPFDSQQFSFHIYKTHGFSKFPKWAWLCDVLSSFSWVWRNLPTLHHRTVSFPIIFLHQIKIYVNNSAGKSSLFPDNMAFRDYKFEVLKIFDRKSRGVRNIRLVPTKDQNNSWLVSPINITDWKNLFS